MTRAKYDRWLHFLRKRRNQHDQDIGSAYIVSGKYFRLKSEDGCGYTHECGVCVGAMYHHFCLVENLPEDRMPKSVFYNTGRMLMARDFIDGVENRRGKNIEPVINKQLIKKMEMLSKQLIETMEMLAETGDFFSRDMDAPLEAFSGDPWPVEPYKVFEKYGEDMEFE